MYWFKPLGRFFYVPISWEGVVVTLFALAFCTHIFLFVDGRSHSVTDTLYGVFPFIVPCLLALNWIAFKTSPSTNER